MKSVLFFLFLSLLSLCVFAATSTPGYYPPDEVIPHCTTPTNGGQVPDGPCPPCQRPDPITCIDENCHCSFDWIGAPSDNDHLRLKDIFYGSYHDFDNWSPAPVLFNYPCEVCFVTIRGPGTTFIDNDAKVNTLTIGGNQWDLTNVFVGGAGRTQDPVILTIGYDDIPVIKRVDGERLCNGQTLLTITGKGFGFCADDLTITVEDHTEDRAKWNQYDASDHCDYPNGCDYPGLPSIIDVPATTYECEDVRIFYLDQKISCRVSIPDIYASQLWVKVQVNVRDPPLSDEVKWLTTYVK